MAPAMRNLRRPTIVFSPSSPRVTLKRYRAGQGRGRSAPFQFGKGTHWADLGSNSEGIGIGIELLPPIRKRVPPLFWDRIAPMAHSLLRPLPGAEMRTRRRAGSLGLLDREMPGGACLQGDIGDPVREFPGVIERGGDVERRSGLPAALGAAPKDLTATGSPVLGRPVATSGARPSPCRAGRATMACHSASNSWVIRTGWAISLSSAMLSRQSHGRGGRSDRHGRSAQTWGSGRRRRALSGCRGSGVRPPARRCSGLRQPVGNSSARSASRWL